MYSYDRVSWTSAYSNNNYFGMEIKYFSNDSIFIAAMTARGDAGANSNVPSISIVLMV
jgi:hypothetical protein